MANGINEKNELITPFAGDGCTTNIMICTLYISVCHTLVRLIPYTCFVCGVYRRFPNLVPRPKHGTLRKKIRFYNIRLLFILLIILM